MRHFDLCVIGSGPAGQKAAIQAAKLGKRVVVVEKRQVVGGEAVNAGTIPSKALREAIVNLTGRPPAMPRYEDFTQARNETFENLLASCNRVITEEIDMIRQHFSRNGIEVVYGRGSFIEPNRIEIVGQTAKSTVTADKFLIATGSRPASAPRVDYDGTTIISSDGLLKLAFLPHSIIVVGGGVIGTEYASMLAALGVKVTIVEGRSRVLDFVDAEIIEALQYHLRQSGVTLRLGEKVVKIETIDAPAGSRTADNRMAQATLESGKTLRADCLLYAVGRQGSTDGLGLEVVGIEADKRGRIEVNEHFQTKVGHVYAAGDVIGFPALASTSMEQGRLAACHMFGRPTTQVPELLPYGIYAVPEISMVGWTEQQLTDEGIPYESGIAQYREIARGQLLGDEIGMLKMLIHQETRHILGVHIIGTGATELVHIGQAAIAFKATVDYFVEAVFNYPTLAECYKVAALNGVNKLLSV
ncbi:MAG: Si-specific NAD(P)(+) transhydrogenase [Phycisphaerales bacterium JB037]